ncbi:hypothetical protein B194_1201 [Serratia plymuthica A30]|nr:hypothetical protein B194_1201 [Serratia plymuthica A30]
MRPDAQLKIRYTDAKRRARWDGDNSLRKHGQNEHISKKV